MSAEVLRRAAALMRERAEAATPGPYVSVAHQAGIVCTDCMGTEQRHWFAGITPEGHYSPHTWLTGTRAHDEAAARGDSEHIASWHPVVALAVADWLEVTAKDVGTSSLSFHAALAVARAYLGEQP